MSGIVFTQQRSKNKLAGYQYINKCDIQNCPISDACPHCGNVVQCKLHKDYMTNILDTIQAMIDNGTIDRMQVSVICNSILPLYHHLFKFQLIEMGQESPVIYGKQIYMHPVYKEIRNTTKTIFELWKGLGLVKTNVPMSSLPVSSMDNSGYMDALTANTTVEDAEVKKAIANLPDDEPDEDSDDEPTPVIKVPMRKGELQKARQGVTGRAKALYDILDEEAAEARNSVKVVGETADGQPILVDADFDPTQLPEDDIQMSFFDALEK